jgi:hypothetical protein
MLVAVAFVAAWLASFNSYALADILARVLLLFVTLGALSYALRDRGTNRTFWVGFVFVCCVHLLSPGATSGPEGWWRFAMAPFSSRAVRLVGFEGVWHSLSGLSWVVFVMMLATVGGYFLREVSRRWDREA